MHDVFPLSGRRARLLRAAENEFYFVALLKREVTDHALALPEVSDVWRVTCDV